MSPIGGTPMRETGDSRHPYFCSENSGRISPGAKNKTPTLRSFRDEADPPKSLCRSHYRCGGRIKPLIPLRYLQMGALLVVSRGSRTSSAVFDDRGRALRRMGSRVPRRVQILSGIAVEAAAVVRWDLGVSCNGTDLAPFGVTALVGLDRAATLARSPHSDPIDHENRIEDSR